MSCYRISICDFFYKYDLLSIRTVKCTSYQMVLSKLPWRKVQKEVTSHQPRWWEVPCADTCHAPPPQLGEGRVLRHKWAALTVGALPRQLHWRDFPPCGLAGEHMSSFIPFVRLVLTISLRMGYFWQWKWPGVIFINKSLFVVAWSDQGHASTNKHRPIKIAMCHVTPTLVLTPFSCLSSSHPAVCCCTTTMATIHTPSVRE